MKIILRVNSWMCLQLTRLSNCSSPLWTTKCLCKLRDSPKLSVHREHAVCILNWSYKHLTDKMTFCICNKSSCMVSLENVLMKCERKLDGGGRHRVSHHCELSWVFRCPKWANDFVHMDQLINFLLFFAFKLCCKALDFAMNFSISSYI